MSQSKNHEVNDFQKDVLDRSHIVPVLVDFWAEWCGPCKTLGPILERLAATSNNRWVLAKVDTDAHQDLAATYGIRSIPNVKLFVDGKFADEFVGALPEYAVRKWLEKAVPGRYRKELERSEAFIRDGKTAEAQALLEQVLANEPANEQARVLLSRTVVFGNPAKALALVGDIEEHSEQFAAADSIKTIAGLLGASGTAPGQGENPAAASYNEGIRLFRTMDFGGALRNFIDVIRTDRTLADDGARKACIAIFRFLGDEHPVTKEYRRAFSSALY